MRLRYYLLDVFTDRPFGGNQLAVFTDGRTLSSEHMQSIAGELNLSETTFVLPPSDGASDYRVRIFTQRTELPMAGHPSIGTACVLAREKGDSLIRLEEGVGIVPVQVKYFTGRPYWAQMQQPLPVFGPVYEDSEYIARMLSLTGEDIDEALPLEVVSCGVPYLLVPLKSLKALEAIRFRVDVWESKLKEFEAPAVFVFTRDVRNAGCMIRARMFAPQAGIIEDPATGSACGPMGCYLVRQGLAKAGENVIVEQGVEMGRPSRIEVVIETRKGEISAVKVGGNACLIGDGYLEQPAA